MTTSTKLFTDMTGSSSIIVFLGFEETTWKGDSDTSSQDTTAGSLNDQGVSKLLIT